MVLEWVVSSYTAVAEAIMALFSSGGENSGSRKIMREVFIKINIEIDRLASVVQESEEQIKTIFQLWEEQIEVQIGRCDKIRASVSCLKEELKFISVDDLRELKIEIASRGPTLEEALIECEKNLASMDEKLKVMSERKLISVLVIRKMFDDIIKKHNTVFPGSYGRTFANRMALITARSARTLEELERMLEKYITLVRQDVGKQKATVSRMITIIREDQNEIHELLGQLRQAARDSR